MGIFYLHYPIFNSNNCNTKKISNIYPKILALAPQSAHESTSRRDSSHHFFISYRRENCDLLTGKFLFNLSWMEILSWLTVKSTRSLVICVLLCLCCWQIDRLEYVSQVSFEWNIAQFLHLRIRINIHIYD